MSKSLKRRIYDILTQLGMPKNLVGYKYVKKALELLFEDYTYIDAMTTRLYPKIASLPEFLENESLLVTSSTIDRGIRYAIIKAIDLGNREKIEEMFGYTYAQYKSKPNPQLFLATVYEWLIEEFDLE